MRSALALASVVAQFGRMEGEVRNLHNNKRGKVGNRTVAVVVSLCESLKVKTSPMQRGDWRPELFYSFFADLQLVHDRAGWTFHIYDHLHCSSPIQSKRIEHECAQAGGNYTLMPNEGRECGAYFRYIIDHYDSLPDTTIFIHGDAMAHLSHQLYSMEEVLACLNFEKEFSHLNACTNTFTHDAEKTKGHECWIDHWKLFTRHNPHFAQSAFPTKIYSPTIMNAQFAVQRSRIQLAPQAFYQELYKFVMAGGQECKCKSQRGCDQCVGLEPVWWMVFGEPINNMPMQSGAYDRQRLKPECQGERVRRGYTLTKQLKNKYKRVDFVDSRAVMPHFLIKFQKRGLCRSFSTYPARLVHRHILWAMSFCDGLSECTAFATVLHDGKETNVYGSSLLFRGLDLQAARAMRKLVFKAASALDPPYLEGVEPMEKVGGGSLFKLRSPQVDNRSVYISVDGVKLFENPHKMTVYVKKQKQQPHNNQTQLFEITEPGYH